MGSWSRVGVVSVLASAVMLGGCGGHYHYGHHRGGSGTMGVLIAGAVVGAAVVAASSPRPRVYVHQTRTYYVSTPPAFVLTPPPPDGPVRFDAQEARSRLNAADVSECRDEHGTTGYGHAKVTFNPDGRVSKVVVDQPANLSPETVACIGERLGRTMVTAYNGSLVTMGTSFYLR